MTHLMLADGSYVLTLFTFDRKKQIPQQYEKSEKDTLMEINDIDDVTNPWRSWKEDVMNTIQFFTDKNCFPACDPLDVLHRPVGADLFELQIFLVDIGNGKNAWYGSLQNVIDGEKHYFKGWSGLAANLQGILTPVAQLEVLKTLVIL